MFHKLTGKEWLWLTVNRSSSQFMKALLKGTSGSKLIPAKKKYFIYVLGGPGSGKGTQCRYITEKRARAQAKDTVKVRHIVPGDLLRSEVRKGSELGMEIEKTIRKGDIVRPEVTWPLLRQKFHENVHTPCIYLVDGFPRDMDNVELMTKSKTGQLDFLLFYDCCGEDLRKRLLKRSETSGRSDDNLETIEARIETYKSDTMPVINHFKSLGLVHRIDASGPVEEVCQDTETFLRRFIESIPPKDDALIYNDYIITKDHEFFTRSPPFKSVPDRILERKESQRIVDNFAPLEDVNILLYNRAYYNYSYLDFEVNDQTVEEGYRVDWMKYLTTNQRKIAEQNLVMQRAEREAKAKKYERQKITAARKEVEDEIRREKALKRAQVREEKAREKVRVKEEKVRLRKAKQEAVQAKKAMKGEKERARGENEQDRAEKHEARAKKKETRKEKEEAQEAQTQTDVEKVSVGGN